MMWLTFGAAHSTPRGLPAEGWPPNGGVSVSEKYFIRSEKCFKQIDGGCWHHEVPAWKALCTPPRRRWLWGDAADVHVPIAQVDNDGFALSHFHLLLIRWLFFLLLFDPIYKHRPYPVCDGMKYCFSKYSFCSLLQQLFTSISGKWIFVFALAGCCALFFFRWFSIPETFLFFHLLFPVLIFLYWFFALLINASPTIKL